MYLYQQFFRAFGNYKFTMIPNAIEVLFDERERPVPFLSQIFNPLFGGILGVSCAIFVNFVSKKPILSGIQKHIIFGAVGLGAGKFFDGIRNEELAKRDAVMRHYIQLHPEDFPMPEGKKYKELLTPWVPVR
ncbi:hypothetical protein J437_LFUL000497 [Ladona fulva]|uniref:NADH dehydrogenase [ubiquinone] 1 subunit C2 n=1 Tax=Ladona fulva TaxID=123851 RepID=A0A8K0JT95_LADFU|nr:hypothetical protein J437_LFUL000497 [Ladona fulva]